eukprot:scaffold4454_cov496-Pinguiococcus_pyrenoidosus.AAC.1
MFVLLNKGASVATWTCRRSAATALIRMLATASAGTVKAPGTTTTARGTMINARPMPTTTVPSTPTTVGTEPSAAAVMQASPLSMFLRALSSSTTKGSGWPLLRVRQRAQPAARATT